MSTHSPLTVLIWLDFMAPQSIVLNECRKLVSAIIVLADGQLISLKPRSTRMHSHTNCTCLGGLAKDLREGAQGKWWNSTLFLASRVVELLHFIRISTHICTTEVAADRAAAHSDTFILHCQTEQMKMFLYRISVTSDFCRSSRALVALINSGSASLRIA